MVTPKFSLSLACLYILEEFNKVFDEKLKEYGISSVKGENGKEKWVYSDGKSSMEFDPTGNLDFAKKQMSYMTNNEQ